jgi:hypothetical protein
MVIKEAPILYGLIGWIPDPNEPSYCMEHYIFPHYRETALGSCEIFSDSPKTRTILICNKCKDAYEEWNKEN